MADCSSFLCEMLGSSTIVYDIQTERHYPQSVFPPLSPHQLLGNINTFSIHHCSSIHADTVRLASMSQIIFSLSNLVVVGSFTKTVPSADEPFTRLPGMRERDETHSRVAYSFDIVGE